MTNLQDEKRYVRIEDIYNDYTLNIFSDASSEPGRTDGVFCYGSIVVNKDTILDSFYTLHEDCNCSYDAELLGLRASLYYAVYYKKKFYNKIKQINIFCDNIAAINAVLEYSYRYKCRYFDNYKTYLTVNSSKEIVEFESTLNECYYVWRELNSLDESCSTNILHQKSHILDSKIEVIKKKEYQYIDSFIANNELNLYYYEIDIDPDFIFYISKYNCIVDETTKLYMKDYKLRWNWELFKLTSVPIEFKHPDTPKDYYLSKEEKK